MVVLLFCLWSYVRVSGAGWHEALGLRDNRYGARGTGKGSS